VAALDAAGMNILVTGVGGTGVLTVGALLGMAAHLDRRGCTVLDMTGMAQKGGAVTSHIRIGPDPAGIYSSRLGEGMSDLLIACDMIVASGVNVLRTLRPGHSAAVLNSDVAPTGDFQSNKNLDLNEDRLRAAVVGALGEAPLFELPASRLATALTGDSIATNILMLGYAAQKGLLPVSIASLEEAIRLNGSFVAGNLRTFGLGRLAAHAPQELEKEIGGAVRKVPLETVDEVLASRARLLTAYQDERYAARYREFVEAIRARVGALRLAEGERFVREVALSLARLMSYKDEYEVARLYTDPAFMRRLHEQFAGDFKLSFHLAPPMLPGKDGTGRPRKRQFGCWTMGLFRVLRHLKGLRGTPFDVFGWFPERRLERRLIVEYRALIERLSGKLDAANIATGIELAHAAWNIAGYGPVKEAAAQAYQAQLAELLQRFEQAGGTGQSRAA
jgi:indolepyruvate ferredoxin oxidoreductase